MRNVVILLVSLLALASCTVEEQVSFNDDYSGDMKWGLRFSSELDDEGEDKPDFELVKAVEHLEDIDGVTQVEVVSEANGQFIKFKFDDIEALNKGYYQLGFIFLDSEEDTLDYVESYKDFKYFSKSGNLFSYRNNMDEDDFDDMEEAELMLAMIGYEIILSFPDEIKKVSSKKVEVLNKHTLRLETNLAEVIENPELFNFDVKLK